MLKTRVIPTLLLKDLGLVKSVKFEDYKYVGDPINAVMIFNEKEVDELAFLNISATVKGEKPPFELLSRIASEAFMPFSYGGGIRSVEDAKKILKIGVEKIVINSYAVENPNFIKEVVEYAGGQSVVISIDVKGNQVYTQAGRKATGLNPVHWSIQAEKLGAGEIFLNSIEKDGTMKGYDTDLIKRVSEAVNIPVIACGGAGKIEDFTQAVRAGASAVAAGSLFVFIGPYRAVLISYPDREEIEKVLA